jgi:hypothetical protein
LQVLDALPSRRVAYVQSQKKEKDWCELPNAHLPRSALQLCKAGQLIAFALKTDHARSHCNRNGDHEC